MSRQERRAKQRQQKQKPMRHIPKANPWVIGGLALFAIAFLVIYFIAHSN